jgi:hypothetical protein
MMQKLFSQQIRFKADDGSEFGEWEEKLWAALGFLNLGRVFQKIPRWKNRRSFFQSFRYEYLW